MSNSVTIKGGLQLTIAMMGINGDPVWIQEVKDFFKGPRAESLDDFKNMVEDMFGELSTVNFVEMYCICKEKYG